MTFFPSLLFEPSIWCHVYSNKIKELLFVGLLFKTHWGRRRQCQAIRLGFKFVFVECLRKCHKKGESHGEMNQHSYFIIVVQRTFRIKISKKSWIKTCFLRPWFGVDGVYHSPSDNNDKSDVIFFFVFLSTLFSTLWNQKNRIKCNHNNTTIAWSLNVLTPQTWFPCQYLDWLSNQSSTQVTFN